MTVTPTSISAHVPEQFPSMSVVPVSPPTDPRVAHPHAYPYSCPCDSHPMSVTPTCPPTLAQQPPPCHPPCASPTTLSHDGPLPLPTHHYPWSPTVPGVQRVGDSDKSHPVPTTALKALESSSRRALQGLVFLVGNGLGLALALYKCQAMGLLPTRPSDWLAFVAPPQVRPEAGFPPALPHPRCPGHQGPLTHRLSLFSLGSAWNSLGGA